MILPHLPTFLQYPPLHLLLTDVTHEVISILWGKWGNSSPYVVKRQESEIYRLKSNKFRGHLLRLPVLFNDAGVFSAFFVVADTDKKQFSIIALQCLWIFLLLDLIQGGNG